jgi:hypothetical protein
MNEYASVDDLHRASVAVPPASEPREANGGRPSARPPEQPVSRVVIVDVHLPLGSIMGLMLKCAIASIPVTLAIVMAGVFIIAFFGELLSMR